MRHSPLLAVALLLAACGSTNTPVDGGSDAGLEAASPDTMPPPDSMPPDAQPDAASDVATDASTGCVDGDHDGYGAGCAMGPDCNDADPAVHPGASEGCDGVDSNCDGNTDSGPDAALDAWCVSTRPALPGVTIDRQPVCRYAGDALATSGFAPFASPQCMEGGFQSGGAYITRCWISGARASDCPYTP